MERERTDPRTHYEATLEVRYAVRWNELNKRLNEKIALTLKAIALLFGSGAVAAFVAELSELSALSGLVIAGVTIIDALWTPDKRAARFDEAMRRFAALSAKAVKLDLVELDQAINELRTEFTDSGVAALADVAYNDMVLQNGRPDYRVPLSRWQRFAALLA